MFLYKTLEIQKYLNRFFGLYKIKIHNCKIFYSDNSLQIFISFYITTKTFSVIGKNITKYSKKCSVTFKSVFRNKQKKNKKKIKNKNIQLRLLSSKKKLEIKNSQKMMIKKNISFNNLKNYSATSLEQFQRILLRSLKTYTKNKSSISITLQNINRYKYLSYAQIKNLKQIFRQLRNFVKNSFFKEAINILYVSITKRKSAKILAEFIRDQFRLNQLKTDQITISRKDNYF